MVERWGARQVNRCFCWLFFERNIQNLSASPFRPFLLRLLSHSPLPSAPGQEVADAPRTVRFGREECSKTDGLLFLLVFSSEKYTKIASLPFPAISTPPSLLALPAPLPLPSAPSQGAADALRTVRFGREGRCRTHELSFFVGFLLRDV